MALAQLMLLLGVTACFGQPLEEEPADVNQPPHIAEDFVSPEGDVVLVESDDEIELSIDTLLDPNPEDALYYAIIGDRTGLIEQATSDRLPTDERFRETFHQFERVDVSIDPCTQRLRDHNHELIRIHVSDRPFDRVTEAGVDIADDGYLQTRRWLLRFPDQLCR